MLSFVATAAPYLLLRGSRPDAILSFHSIPSGLAAFPASALRGIPHVVLFRGGDVPGWLPGELESYHRYTLWLNRWIVYSSRAAIANSEGLRELAQAAFPKKRVDVLVNGIDIENFSPPKGPRSERTEPPTIFFAGRLTTQKGLDVAFEALAKLVHLDWRLVIAGMGPREAEFRRLAAELDIADRVRFVGWASRAQMVELYREADIFLFPSRYEGMPNVVLEAMASGLPVVSTQIAGTEELVSDGENGFLVEVDDVWTLAERLARLLSSRDLQLEMGANARATIEAGWSWKKQAEELEQYVESAIASKP